MYLACGVAELFRSSANVVDRIVLFRANQPFPPHRKDIVRLRLHSLIHVGCGERRNPEICYEMWWWNPRDNICGNGLHVDRRTESGFKDFCLFRYLQSGRILCALIYWLCRKYSLVVELQAKMYKIPRVEIQPKEQFSPNNRPGSNYN